MWTGHATSWRGNSRRLWGGEIEGGGRRTEDGGRRTEDGGRRTEGMERTPANAGALGRFGLFLNHCSGRGARRPTRNE
jgi:hypothetical protein